MAPRIVWVLLGCLGWGLAGWLASRPLPAPQERIVTKVEYRDRIVNRDMEKTTTRPDGTVTKTRVTTAEIEKKVDVSEEHQKSVMSQYRVGLVVRSHLSNNSLKVYGLDLSTRLGGSPLWGSLQINQDRSIAIGLSYEW